MISRLETLGYVQRETSPEDRRADVISILPDGLTALADVAGVWREGDKTIEDILGPEESKRFFALAEDVSKALGGGPPKAETSDQEN